LVISVVLLTVTGVDFVDVEDLLPQELLVVLEGVGLEGVEDVNFVPHELPILELLLLELRELELRELELLASTYESVITANRNINITAITTLDILLNQPLELNILLSFLFVVVIDQLLFLRTVKTH